MEYLNLKLKGNSFISGLQVYIRKSEFTKSDENIFQILGWHDYKIIDNYDDEYLDMLDNYFCITECENWIHMIDSISGALWKKIFSNPSEIKLFENLEISEEIFGFSFYDEVDAEYQFFHIEKGKLNRHFALYQFPSGEWNNSINFGKEMSGESFKCRTENGFENLSSIFSALDIKTDFFF